MRYRLLATTALTAGGYALGALTAHAAEPIHIKVGGYMEQSVGYVDQDVPGKDVTGVDIKSDTEIWFTGSTVLDNGIEFGVNVQLEGNSTADQIDESYLTIGGGFGKLIVGSENSAMYLLHVAPKDYGIGLNSGDNVDWVDFSGVGSDTGVFRGPFASTYVEPGRVNDPNRLTYITPQFGGFQLGASWVPDAVEDSNITVDRETSQHDGVSLAAYYKGSVGPVQVAASAGWGMIQASNASGASDPTAYSTGLSLGIGDWTLAGSFAGSKDDTATGDATGWNIGLNYAPGPWKVLVAGYFGDRDGSSTANAGGSGARKASYDTVQVEAGYDLGPGVSLAGAVGYARLEDRSGFGADTEAVYGITKVRLSF